MPNHVSTTLTVRGLTSEIERFQQIASGGKQNEFDFNNLFPMPEELKLTTSPSNPKTDEEIKTSERLKSQYGHDNWYDWAIANWDTKWGAYDVGPWNIERVSPTESKAELFYYTAWSPATAFYRKVSRDFPDLSFTHKYADEGCAFVGFETFVNGQMKSESKDYDWDSPDGVALRQELGLYFDDEDDVSDDLGESVEIG
jgi:hypothetical protein